MLCSVCPTEWVRNEMFLGCPNRGRGAGAGTGAGACRERETQVQRNPASLVLLCREPVSHKHNLTFPSQAGVLFTSEKFSFIRKMERDLGQGTGGTGQGEIACCCQNTGLDGILGRM